jgi:TRAP-type transport system periplasmic protein
MKTEEAQSVELLKLAGYTFTLARPAEIARAVEAMRPYWDQWAKVRGPQAVEALSKVRTALGR